MTAISGLRQSGTEQCRQLHGPMDYCGYSGSRLALRPSSNAESLHPLTVAGQPRTFTGFPRSKVLRLSSHEQLRVTDC